MTFRRPEDLQALLDEFARAGDGDPEMRIPKLLERVHRIARSQLGPHDALRRNLDSEDLAQEALIDLVRNVHRFEGESWNEFFAFAEAVMNRRKTDLARFHRARKRRRGDETANESPSRVQHPDAGPQTRIADAEAARRARSLLEQLPEAMRVPLERRLEGQNFSTIAQELGLTEATVRKRVSRALAELQRRWRAHG